MEGIPDWFIRFLNDFSYIPTREFIEKLEPQSRLEAILKYGFLNIFDSYESFLVVSENGSSYDEFYDSDNLKFFVLK